MIRALVAAFVRAGSRIVLNRVLGLVHGTEKNTPSWAVDEFERTYCALELDFVRGKHFMERLRPRRGPALFLVFCTIHSFDVPTSTERRLID